MLAMGAHWDSDSKAGAALSMGMHRGRCHAGNWQWARGGGTMLVISVRLNSNGDARGGSILVMVGGRHTGDGHKQGVVRGRGHAGYGHA